jgi:uncharacterized protein
LSCAKPCENSFAIPFGVWLGWRLHGALDQRQVYRACYGLLVVTALKFLWNSVSGHLGVNLDSQ